MTTNPDIGLVRLPDLVAKLSKCTLRDTLRVMLVLDMLGNHFTFEEQERLLPSDPMNRDHYRLLRATPEQVAACERVFSQVLANAENEEYLVRIYDLRNEAFQNG